MKTKNSIKIPQKQFVVKDSVKKVVPKSIFLGLSPTMTNSEFTLEVEKLNEKGNLERNIFTLDTNDGFKEFELTKTTNSIRLEKNVSETRNPTTTNYQISKELLTKYQEQNNNILKIFSKKYQKNKIQLPKNIDLEKYNLNKEEYVLFKDKDKYILFGYSILGDIYPSLEEREIEDELSGQNKMFGYKTLKRESEGKIHYDFGNEIQIDYFDLIYMNNMLEKMNKESKIETNNEIKAKKIIHGKEQNKKNNINEI